MLFQHSLGLDIRDRYIAMAYLQASIRGVRLKGQRRMAIDRSLEPVDRRTRLASAIEAFCSDFQVANADVFVTLGSHQVMVREIQLPLAVKENLRDTLFYEMEKYIPVPAGQLCFDFQIVREDRGNQQMTIILVAVKRQVVDDTVQLLSALGWGMSGMEPGFTAMANYHLLDPAVRESGHAALLWGDDTGCEAVVLTDRRLSRCRWFDPAADRQMPVPAVAAWLHGNAAGGTDDRPPLQLAVMPPDKGQSLLGPLGDDPGFTVLSSRHPMVDGLDPACLFAVGAAVRGIRQSGVEINLLPEKMRKPRSRIGLMTFFALSVLALVAVVVWGGSWVAANRQFVNGLDDHLARLKQEVAVVQEMQARADRLERDIVAINAIAGQRISVLAIARELSREIPDGTWLRSLYLKDDNLRLEGFAQSASDLVSILEQLPLFSEVGFLSPITIDKNGKERFSIGLTVLR